MYGSLPLKSQRVGLSNDNIWYKATLLLKTLFSFTAFVNAQSVPPQKQWDKRFGGKGDGYVSTIVPTSDGGCFLRGSSSSGIGGDITETGRGSDDFWAVKIDRDRRANRSRKLDSGRHVHSTGRSR
jgi:hypothetical protein